MARLGKVRSPSTQSHRECRPGGAYGTVDRVEVPAKSLDTTYRTASLSSLGAGISAWGSPAGGNHPADVAELADALASGASARKGVEVRVLSSASL